jgi:hypothetical protein
MDLQQWQLQCSLPEKDVAAYTSTKIDSPKARAMLSTLVVPRKQAPGITATHKAEMQQYHQWGLQQHASCGVVLYAPAVELRRYSVGRVEHTGRSSAQAGLHCGTPCM